LFWALTSLYLLDKPVEVDPALAKVIQRRSLPPPPAGILHHTRPQEELPGAALELR